MIEIELIDWDDLRCDARSDGTQASQTQKALMQRGMVLCAACLAGLAGTSTAEDGQQMQPAFQTPWNGPHSTLNGEMTAGGHRRMGRDNLTCLHACAPAQSIVLHMPSKLC